MKSVLWSIHKYIKGIYDTIPVIFLQHKRLSCLNSLPKPIADILAEMLDPSILMNKAVIIFSLANIIGMIGFYVPIMFTADRAEKLDVDAKSAAFLISIFGM